MISHGGPDFFLLNDYGFLRDITALLVVIIPSAIGFALWRVFVTNRSEAQQLVTLGILDSGEAMKRRTLPSSLVQLTATLISVIAVYVIGPDNLELFLIELLNDADFFIWFGHRALDLSY